MYICRKHPFLMAITCVYKVKVETHVLLQGSKVIHEDLGRSSNSWRVWGSAVSLPLGVWTQNAIRIQENSVQFLTFWSKI